MAGTCVGDHQACLSSWSEIAEPTSVMFGEVIGICVYWDKRSHTYKGCVIWEMSRCKWFVLTKERSIFKKKTNTYIDNQKFIILFVKFVKLFSS